MAREIINIGTTANDGTGDPLRSAFTKVNNMTAELYTDDASDVNSIVATAPIARNNATGVVTVSLNDLGVTSGKLAANSVITDKILDDNVTQAKMANDSVGADELVDNSVGAIALNVSGNGSNGQALTSDGDGTMSWTTMEVGDITAVTAGAGMTGGGTSGDVTLNAIGGTAITVNAGDIQVTDAGITATQLASNAVITTKILNANVTTAKIADDAVTLDKIADAVFVTEAEGIASNDNDTTLPTSAAVKAYADSIDAFSGFGKTDGNFLVANGSAFIVEAGATARDSIGLGTANHAQLHCLGIGQAASTVNGQINATTVYATTLGYDSNDKITFTNNTQIDLFVNGNNKARLEADGDWQVAGDVIAASTAFSDERLKENIKKIENPLESIKKINGVTYDWKANGQSSVGVIAQNIQEIYPELVKEVQPIEGDEKRLTVNYDGLIGVLIEAVKDLSKQVEDLKK